MENSAQCTLQHIFQKIDGKTDPFPASNAKKNL